MARQRPIPNERAARFEPEELFFSTTDGAGRITACNGTFLRIAGYPPEEVLGAPHSLVRHPDMPRCVFRVLWDRLLAGDPVAAYVKNMTAQGEHYWVFALALPCAGGFLSLRLKPLSERGATIEALYRELLHMEASVLAAGGRKEAAIEASLPQLGAALQSLGFDSYAAFMANSLRMEVAARNSALRARAMTLRPTPFDDLDLLDELTTEARAQAEHFVDVGVATHRIALNSAISAARLGAGGEALGVLSRQIADLAAEIAAQAEELDGARTSLTPVFEEMAYQLASATLIAETRAAFCAEASACRTDAATQAATYGAPLERLAGTLDDALARTLERVHRALCGLRLSLRRFDEVSERFRRVLLTTRISHVTGRTMAAQIQGAEDTAVLLAEMSEGAEGARLRLEGLQRATARLRSAVARWRI